MKFDQVVFFGHDEDKWEWNAAILTILMMKASLKSYSWDICWKILIGPMSDHCLPLSLTHSLKMKSAGKTMLMVFFWRYEFQGLKTFDRTIGISFSINFQCFFPTKIRVRHGILYYAPGRKLCCETELGEVSRCESLVTLHHQSYLRTITSNFILQNISKPLLPRCTGVFCLYVFFYR